MSDPAEAGGGSRVVEHRITNTECVNWYEELSSTSFCQPQFPFTLIIALLYRHDNDKGFSVL
jgi:hypothetical protein